MSRSIAAVMSTPAGPSGPVSSIGLRLLNTCPDAESRRDMRSPRIRSAYGAVGDRDVQGEVAVRVVGVVGHGAHDGDEVGVGDLAGDGGQQRQRISGVGGQQCWVMAALACSQSCRCWAAS